MSKFTDDLFELCKKTVDNYGLSSLFLNFGHGENEDRFYEYVNDMSDVDNLYVIYKYEIYYHGNVVTKEVLYATHNHSAVLPVLGKPITTIRTTWASIFNELEPKRRTDAVLNAMTHKYSLINENIYTPQFYSYMRFLCDSIIMEELTGRRHFSDYVNSVLRHYLVVADDETLEYFKLALKEFFNDHMSIDL